MVEKLKTYFFNIYIFFASLNRSMIGFYIIMGEFGAGKTQNMVKYLRFYNPKKEVNITNFYSGYNNIQLNGHLDIINVLDDIYLFHKYNIMYKYRHLTYFFKPNKKIKYEIQAQEFFKKYPGIDKKGIIKFNLAIDELSLYFNPETSDKNFKGDNAKYLKFFYQFRKINTLFMGTLQSPMEVSVKIRRLCNTYRKYYKGFKIIRWYKDFYFPNPEAIDFDEAECLKTRPFMNMYPLLQLDYLTTEVVDIEDTIYNKGDLINYILKNIPDKTTITFKEKFNFKNIFKFKKQ